MRNGGLIRRGEVPRWCLFLCVALVVTGSSRFTAEQWKKNGKKTEKKNAPAPAPPGDNEGSVACATGWWMPAAGVVECGYNIENRGAEERRSKKTLAVVFYLDSDNVVDDKSDDDDDDDDDSRSIRRWPTASFDHDVVFATENSTVAAVMAASGVGVVKLRSPVSRAAAWNAMQFAGRGAGYEFVLVASRSSYVPHDAMRAVVAALEDGATLALPLLNRAAAGNSKQWWGREEGPHPAIGAMMMLEEKTSTAKTIHRIVAANDNNNRSATVTGARKPPRPTRECLSGCFFGLHLKHTERFAPDLAHLFDNEDQAPANSLVRRMAADRVEPTIVQSAYVHCKTAVVLPPLADTAVPSEIDFSSMVPEKQQQLPKKKTKQKQKKNSHKWIERPGEAIVSGCDLGQVRGSFNLSLAQCKTVYTRRPKCRGISHNRAASSHCLLKSCTTSTPALESISYLRWTPQLAAAEEQEEAPADDGKCAVGPPLEPLEEPKSVAVLITVHDAEEWVERCLRAIWKYAKSGDERDTIYLVNDGSTPETLRRLSRLVDHDGPRSGAFGVRFVNWSALTSVEMSGYTRAINFGLRVALADGGYDAYCLLNSDTEVLSANWLEVLKRAAFSSDKIGIVGPVSNAASYQSVPLRQEGHDWSKNELRDGWSNNDVAAAVARSSSRLLVDVPVLNGFCLLVKHKVVESVGLFDDVSFPHGFGEENDYCLRALAMGYRLRVVDGVYVRHHKSKSYGDETRVALSKISRATMKARWGAELGRGVALLEENAHLAELRRRVDLTVHKSTCRADSLRVLFVLGGGGAASTASLMPVVSQALGLRRRAVCAAIAVAEPPMAPLFLGLFPDDDYYSEMIMLPPDEDDPTQLVKALMAQASSFDVLVATTPTSLRAVARVAQCYPTLQPAYFFQDSHSDELGASSLSPDTLIFTNTRWLRDETKRRSPLLPRVNAIHGSFNLAPFEEARLRQQQQLTTTKRSKKKLLRVVGAVRNNPVATLELLQEFKRLFGRAVEVRTFGCSDEELRAALHGGGSVLMSARIMEQHVGVLAGPGQLARLLAESDVFIDMSLPPTLSPLGLEAMAAGCVPILPVGCASE